jgi:predicted N-acetyltransferase YhbS
MWVTPEHIGTGIGKELFLDAMERAAQMNVSEVELSADPNAAGFYERMGAEKIGEVDSSMDGTTRTIPRMKIDV